MILELHVLGSCLPRDPRPPRCEMSGGPEGPPLVNVRGATLHFKKVCPSIRVVIGMAADRPGGAAGGGPT